MAVVKCVRCKGTGTVFGGASCNLCGGDGGYPVPDPPTPCARCDGTGVVFGGAVCGPCKGYGYVRD